VADVSAGNVKSVLGQPDLVIDAADNFALRFLLNDWSLATQTPWVHGGCVGATGQVRLFSGNGAPCFRCIVPQPPPAASVDTCDTAGVVGSATHVIASLQATEAIKWLTGNHAQVRQTLLSVDLWNNRIREIEIPAELSSSCTACGRGELEFLSGPRGMIAETAAVLCGRDAVQISPPAVDHPTASESSSHSSTIDLSTIADRWSGLGRVQATAFFVRLFPDDTHTLTLFRDGRVVVTGTTDISAARALCDRFVGS